MYVILKIFERERERERERELDQKHTLRPSHHHIYLSVRQRESERGRERRTFVFLFCDADDPELELMDRSNCIRFAFVLTPLKNLDEDPPTREIISSSLLLSSESLITHKISKCWTKNSNLNLSGGEALLSLLNEISNNNTPSSFSHHHH